MYCVFIDFEKAFDSVWRIGLWQTLLSFNINGKCFRIIFNMYDGIRSRIVHNGCKSEYFQCNIGVRQGENLSTFFIFIIFKRFTNIFSHRKHQRYRISNKDTGVRY